MDIRKVKKLIELMEESDITEIEIKEGEDSVRISRAFPSTVVENRNAVQVDKPAASVAEVEKPLGHVVTAEMVGTFYCSPSPDARPFVEIGASVEIGDTLCIIESMKMMNEIKSDKTGEIESISVENEAVVEFGQALFTIS
ncbi:MAG: acetyl-CoA carboxylase biotin carboxyl carrier protein [Pseudomonadales bacterium]|nr:acetyl-CoA carboxylase biotin carboxyl carrier protein [Pseudomonadales bacterium]